MLYIHVQIGALPREQRAAAAPAHATQVSLLSCPRRGISWRRGIFWMRGTREIRQTRRCAPKAIARGTKTKWSAPKSKSVTQTCTKCTPCAWWSKTSAYLRIVSSTWFPNLDLTKRETSTMRMQGHKKLVWIIKIRCSMVREWMATIRGSVDQWRTLLSTSGISTQCLLSILMKAYKEAKNYSRQTILPM